MVLEAAPAPGGRVRTDEVEGYRLDRGFQVLLTAYPAARRWLDFDALRLGEFAPGALVATPDGPGRVSDPWREPSRLWETLRAPIGTLGDKLRVGALRWAATRGDADAVWDRALNRTTAEELARRGFTPMILERFLRPWLGGIFLERDLTTPAAMLFFVYRMFAEGRAALPAGGMGRIPEQLAAGLEADRLRLGARVTVVRDGEVELADGEIVRGREIVIATEADPAARWLPETVPAPTWRSVTCVHWAAPASPFAGEPVLWLNGLSHGRINNVVVPSDVADDYAPKGTSLVSTTLLGDAPENDAQLPMRLTDELHTYFGPETRTWRALGVHRVRRALPALARPGTGEAPKSLRRGLWVCGDHTASASIQGAMASGAAVAEAIAAKG